MRRDKKRKKVFNLYNIVAVICTVVIVVSIYVLFIVDNSTQVKIVQGVKVIQTDMDENEEIVEEQAKKIAVKQFKNLGEKTKESKLKVSKIKREQEEYYYITSAENSLEIKIKGGKIERINSVIVK